MDKPIACVILRGTANDWYFFPFIVACGFASIAVVRWRFFVQWLEGVRGRNWAATSAVVDIVSVAAQTMQGRGGETVVGYVATLTYFYRNPELQTGDYSRMFQTEGEAQAWADSYKGSTVTVHVDPHDATRSVLRKEEI